ncbi:hypothetical protein [Mesonia aestuariivivens]|uniref:Fibronectin type-III domain-containing protein n=1 Tax=Mesonia aestuariivivens TaxID=2796128 RepID=A0ABS6W4Z2_9FLAO|nr:hypothetical protein [Mesonia aestuariivivens]MBW2962935.1 hypothetical protein [Mesonia aestuariivivens]
MKWIICALLRYSQSVRHNTKKKPNQKNYDMRLTFKILILLTIFTSCSNSDDENNPDCTYTPDLSAEEASNITETSATFSGQIISPTCESTVTSQGFVYAKTTLPKTDDFVVEVNGENILAEVNNLERNTKYYMRAFFVNPSGEYYSNQIELTTVIGEINITTKTIENIALNSATSGGIINDDGDGTIINKGICWSTSQNPTIDDNHIENNTNNYEFNSEITGLQENTTYYVRAYAMNESGIAYGNEETFKTLAPTYKVNLEITGTAGNCGFSSNVLLHYEINYKFDDSDTISETAEGSGDIYYHEKEGEIRNNLNVTIYLGYFDPEYPNNSNYPGSYLDNISITITHIATNEEVLNTTLPDLFICTDSAYKNIINFNPVDRTYTIDRLTYGF